MPGVVPGLAPAHPADAAAGARCGALSGRGRGAGGARLSPVPGSGSAAQPGPPRPPRPPRPAGPARRHAPPPSQSPGRHRAGAAAAGGGRGGAERSCRRGGAGRAVPGWCRAAVRGDAMRCGRRDRARGMRGSGGSPQRPGRVCPPAARRNGDKTVSLRNAGHCDTGARWGGAGGRDIAAGGTAGAAGPGAASRDAAGRSGGRARRSWRWPRDGRRKVTGPRRLLQSASACGIVLLLPGKQRSKVAVPARV